MIRVGWVTKDGKTDREQRRVASIITELYIKLLKEFRISRPIKLLLVDEASWKNKTGLNMNSRSVAQIS